MLTSLDATDPTTHASVVARLCAELQRPVPGPPPSPPCPYPGMRPFGEEQSDRFFGRDEEAQSLLRRLRGHPFLTEDCAHALLDRGVALVGTDSLNVDDTATA